MNLLDKLRRWLKETPATRAKRLLVTEKKRHDVAYSNMQEENNNLETNQENTKMSRRRRETELAKHCGVNKYKIALHPHKENDGRWGVIEGYVYPTKGVDRVSMLVFSHDEKWYGQKPALDVDCHSGHFKTDVAFGLEKVAAEGREYIVVAVVGPQLPVNAVFDSLNDLPEGCSLSAPLSVLRTDPE